MGQITTEHSQNYYLSKVLELNARLRSSFAATNKIGRQERKIKDSLNSNNSFDSRAPTTPPPDSSQNSSPQGRKSKPIPSSHG
mmetsp:Transcript_22117/g.38957  ORF Transcript_22117/g.38957 Transcript_22117/m.38957 type:complete len:83 (-) Transcript_22117:734-982(-)